MGLPAKQLSGGSNPSIRSKVPGSKICSLELICTLFLQVHKSETFASVERNLFSFFNYVFIINGLIHISSSERASSPANRVAFGILTNCVAISQRKFR